MKKLFYLISAAVLALALCSCEKTTKVTLDENVRPQATDNSSWSVFVYMCGNSDMKNQEIFDELCFTDYPENINIVIQTADTDETYLQRFAVQKGSMVLKDQKPTESMGAYETLQSYIQWGTENYPSEKYMLLIAGDGTGREVLCDKKFDNDTLTVEELSYAVSMSGRTFDIIGFDGAYTASLEMAIALSPYANYMVASEEKCAGWDYRGLAECLIEYPFVSPQELSCIICDKYYQKCTDNNSEKTAAMSVVDLSHISQLAQTFDGMADTMTDTVDSLDSYAELSRNILTAQKCIGSDDMIDVASMAAAIAPNIGQPSQEVIDSVANTVIYNVKGKYRPMSNGLCVYYPQSIDKDKLTAYMSAATSDNYKHFIKCISPGVDITDKFVNDGYEESWAWCDYVGREYGGTAYVDGESKYTLQINGEINITKDASLKKYFYYPSANAYYSLGTSKDLYCDWGSGIYKDDSDYKIPRLGRQPVQMNYEGSVNDLGNFYSVPIILNDEVGEIIVFNPWNSEKYEITGIWQNGAIVKPSPKNYIAPLHNIRDDNETRLPGKTVRYMPWLSIRDSSLLSGKYIFEYELEDIYSKVRTTAPASVTKTGGEITITQ